MTPPSDKPPNDGQLSLTDFVNTKNSELHEALLQWRELRAAGMPSGAQTREAMRLRTLLLDAGLWEEVYGTPDDDADDDDA